MPYTPIFFALSAEKVRVLVNVDNCTKIVEIPDVSSSGKVIVLDFVAVSGTSIKIFYNFILLRFTVL